MPLLVLSFVQLLLNSAEKVGTTSVLQQLHDTALKDCFDGLH
jgi:hypothetical protein